MFVSFGCALLGVDSLRGGLAEGNRISKTDFFDILTIRNQISHVKDVLDPLYVFFTPFGCLGGGGGKGVAKGLGHNLLLQLSTLCSSKMEITSQRLLDQC